MPESEAVILPAHPLEKQIIELATDPDQQAFFSMSEVEIKGYLSRIVVSDKGFRISPGFLSTGFGLNESQIPAIAPSDLGNNEGILKHELRHALHMFACTRLFESSEFQSEAVELFKNNVLNDAEFVSWIQKNSNETGKKNFKDILDLFDKNPNSEEIAKRASTIGAIVYQHAYYLDPTIIEAIGSFEDSDAFLVTNEFLNRNFGLLLPGKQPLEGYGNKKYQQLVKEAGPMKMAMMTTPENYKESNWLEYWK